MQGVCALRRYALFVPVPCSCLGLVGAYALLVNVRLASLQI